MRLNRIKWEYVVLVLIILAGFLIRSYNLYGDFPFDGNDNPFFATVSIRFASLDAPLQSFLELMNFRWGTTTPLVLVINIFFADLFGLKITETLITLPIVLIGTLTIFMIYLLGKEFKNKYVGLMSAAFLAVLPLHAAQSRTIGGSYIVSPFLLLLTVYLLKKYFYENKYSLWVSLSLSFYLISTSLFGGVLPLIPFIVFLSVVDKQKKSKKIRRSLKLLKGNLPIVIKKIFKIKNFILPVLFLGIPVISYIVFLFYGFKDFGYMGHILNRTGGGPGIYISSLFMDFVIDCGIYLVILFIIASIYSVKKLINLEKESIFLVWAGVYTVPFLFLIRPDMTVVSGYLNSVIMPLIILMCIFFFDVISYFRERKNVLFKILEYSFILTIIVVFILTSITMMGVVHKIPEGYHLLQGSVYPNTGAKTAGYYIRENYGDAKLFTDLRPATGHYYFHAPVVSSTDMDKTELFTYFSSISKNIDLVIFREDNSHLIGQFLKDFTELAEIRSKGKTIMRIYGQGVFKQEPRVLNTEDYDKLFDEKYGNIESLNFGLEQQIKNNKKLNNLMAKLENGFFGFLFS